MGVVECEVCFGLLWFESGEGGYEGDDYEGDLEVEVGEYEVG